AVLGLGAAVGYWLRGRDLDPQRPEWAGEMILGGGARAFSPRVSPDGQTIAFVTLVRRLNQVAVMKPGAGDWIVLSQKDDAGTVGKLDWSRDGTKIFFDRITDVPNGIYSIPALGGPERIVLADAQGPETLPDGSLLVVKVDADRTFRINRFWPDTGKVQPLGPRVTRDSAGLAVRAFPDGREAVFYGKLAEGSDGFRHAYLLDVASGQAKRFAPDILLNPPLAPSADGRSVLGDLVAGDLHEVIAVSREGTDVHRLLSLSSKPWYLSEARDGTLFVGLGESPVELLRFSPLGGVPERIGASARNVFMHPVAFPDGRVLLPNVVSGRRRLLAGRPGEPFRPFLDASEQSSPPVALVGAETIALMSGGGPQRPPVLTLATIADGRVVKRFEELKGLVPLALAASPDGKMLYYVDAGSLFSLDVASGASKKMRAANGIAVDPRTGDLVVQLDEANGVKLSRIPAGLGAELPIPIMGDLKLSPAPLSPFAVGPAGRIVVSVGSKDSSFAGPALLDADTGVMARVPLQFDGDVTTVSWTPDGSLLGLGAELRSELWRFKRRQPLTTAPTETAP
ncbi:MAG TPA: hypothetical protein VGR00_03760, partial [Thermoanaerobaculia bacterium]|nr:hypothetical protein [Thermoanaerobaculia bacterium]